MKLRERDGDKQPAQWGAIIKQHKVIIGQIKDYSQRDKIISDFEYRQLSSVYVGSCEGEESWNLSDFPRLILEPSEEI